jgi:N-acetylglucosaminyl-diphospho-decaprenol L-rhamnosyltransferase
VIVSYNVRDYLAACLAALPEATAGLSFETFVVDNASGDGSADLVRDRFPGVHLIANTVNLGFARAVNQALPLAAGRYFLLLNPDGVPPKDSLAALVAEADRWPRVGLVAPMVCHPETGETQAQLKPFLTWPRLFERRTAAKLLLRLMPRAWVPEVGRPTTSGWLGGACLLVRREVWQAVGGLDERFFMWYEDMEYSRRVIAAGWKLLWTPHVQVLHWGARSAVQRPPWTIELEQVRSMLTYLDGEPGGPRPWLRRLFKSLWAAGLATRVVASGAKTAVYALAGRPGPAAKHRRRLHRALGVLGRLPSIVEL